MGVTGGDWRDWRRLEETGGDSGLLRSPSFSPVSLILPSLPQRRPRETGGGYRRLGETGRQERLGERGRLGRLGETRGDPGDWRRLEKIGGDWRRLGLEETGDRRRSILIHLVGVFEGQRILFIFGLHRPRPKLTFRYGSMKAK